MILGVAIPIRNEPGLFNTDEGSKAAMDDVKKTQRQVLEHAITFWITQLQKSKPDAKHAVWRDVTQKYWKYNAKDVLDNVTAWTITNSKIRGAKNIPDRERPFNKLAKLVQWIENNPTLMPGDIDDSK